VRIDYLIRAHTAPEQLARLVGRLDEGNVRFYVHVNALTDDETFAAMQDGCAAATTSSGCPGSSATGGGFSLLEATFSGIEAILASGDLPDHALLLSGQDYPLRHPSEIEAFLEAGAVATCSTTSGFRPRNGSSRAAASTGCATPLRTHPRSNAAAALPFPRLAERPRALWRDGVLGLTGKHARDVMSFVAERPEILRSFRRTKIPDETFFQTVIMSGPLAATVDNEELHYVDWSAGSAHPAVLASPTCPSCARRTSCSRASSTPRSTPRSSTSSTRSPPVSLSRGAARLPLLRLRLEHVFADLGTLPLANSNLREEDLDKPERFYPLTAYVCGECFLVQLPESASPAGDLQRLRLLLVDLRELAPPRGDLRRPDHRAARPWSA
jgi:hypothetical protein